MERTVERPPIRVIALRWQREWVVKSLANWSSAIGYPALRSWLFEGRMPFDQMKWCQYMMLLGRAAAAAPALLATRVASVRQRPSAQATDDRGHVVRFWRIASVGDVQQYFRSRR
jgi:hypothetical protein